MGFSIYIVSTILWFLLVFFLKLEITPLTIGIIIVPPIVFALNWYFAEEGEEDPCPNSIQVGNEEIISFAVLINSILIGWSGNSDKTNLKIIYRPIVAAFILMMFSLVDIKTVSSKSRGVRDFLGSLQTMSLALITYSLSRFYIS